RSILADKGHGWGPIDIARLRKSNNHDLQDTATVGSSSRMLTTIELSRENALHNMGQFRGLVRPGTSIAAVVKGNAYGHGMPEMIQILEPVADYFQVDDLLEL